MELLDTNTIIFPSQILQPTQILIFTIVCSYSVISKPNPSTYVQNPSTFTFKLISSVPCIITLLLYIMLVHYIGSFPWASKPALLTRQTNQIFSRSQITSSYHHISLHATAFADIKKNVFTLPCFYWLKEN